MLRIPIEKTCWKHKGCQRTRMSVHEAGWGSPRSLALKFNRGEYTTRLYNST